MVASLTIQLQKAGNSFAALLKKSSISFHRKYTTLRSKAATQHDRRAWIKMFLLSQAQKNLTDAEIKQWRLVKDEKGL